MDDGKELGLSDGTDVGSAVGQMEMLGFIDGCEVGAAEFDGCADTDGASEGVLVGQTDTLGCSEGGLDGSKLGPAEG